MSKYEPLWEYVRDMDMPAKLTFDEIRAIAGAEIDHSFLNYKKELLRYGRRVGKISMKEKTIIFEADDVLRKDV